MTDMLYDADIRDDLCDYLEEKYGKVRFFDELVIGKTRADIVFVTEDCLIGVEIKSDADSYARLPRQIRDYDRFFDRNYVAVGGSHGKHIFEHVPDHWGVLTVDEVDGKADIYELRPPDKSPKMRLTNQMGLLWKSELLHIQLKHGLHKYGGKSKMHNKKYIMANVDADVLKKEMLEELFERDYSIYRNEEQELDK